MAVDYGMRRHEYTPPAPPCDCFVLIDSVVPLFLPIVVSLQAKVIIYGYVSTYQIVLLIL